MRIRRAFVDVPDGQAHCRLLGDPSLPALVALHGSPGSGYSLMPLAQHLATGRHVIALDTLGNGDSSPAGVAEPDIAYLAEAHMAAIDALGLDRFDLYGHHTGAALCTELSIRHAGRIGRIVMDGVSVFEPGESAGLLAHDHAPDIVPDMAGTQFAAAWTMVRDAHVFWPWWDRRVESLRGLGLPDAGYLHGEALEVLKASRTYYHSYRAALRYPKRERLKLVRNPVLVTCCPTDQLFAHRESAASLIPGAVCEVSPERQTEQDRAACAALMLAFLDAR
ncbi:MAG: alpha/beta hydrolase [Acetobacteraceae bacterium]